MKVTVNGQTREITISSVGTIEDVVEKIQNELPQGKIITDIYLNDKVLEISSWNANASKTYVLDEDVIDIKVEESTVIGQEILANSKPVLRQIIDLFGEVADSFRINDETLANEKFATSIDSLRWFLKLLEDATILLGRPFSTIIDKDIEFSQYVNELVVILEKVIVTQSQKDWVMLADMIEYEMKPALEKIGQLYVILDV